MNQRVGGPYIGLRRFEAEDAHLFFGREREVLAIIARLRERRFIMVTGESGCGKSSLLRAGVIPALHRGAMTGAASAWRIATMQPGGRPMLNLARALAEALADESADGAALERESALIETVLRSSSRGLLEVERQWRPREDTPTADSAASAATSAVDEANAPNLLVLVDQFEEIFRFKDDAGGSGADEEAREFVRMLLTAGGDGPGNVYCVLTMRSDFLGECAQFAGLPEAINRGECLLSRMTRDELRLVVTGPAAVAGLQVSPLLVTEVVNDMGDEPGRLPVLQHALMRACQEWERDHRDHEPVGPQHFRQAGGLERALSNHANETLEQLNEPDQRLAEKIFRALTEVDLGGRPIRRATSFETICAVCDASPGDTARVIQHFAAPGRNFLTVGDQDPALQPAAIVDLTHESLMKQWERLTQWMHDEYRDAELYRSLTRDAALHARKEKGYWRDPELALGLQWRASREPNAAWAERYAPGYAGTMHYLEESAAARGRERLVRRGLIGAAVVLLLTAAGALGLWLQDENTRLERQIHELMARNPELSAEAQRLRDENRELQWNLLQLQAASDRLREEIARLQRAGDSLRAEGARLERRIADLDIRVAALTREIAALRTQRADLDREAKDLARHAADLRASNRELRAALVGARVLPGEVAVRIPAVAAMPPHPPAGVTAMASRSPDRSSAAMNPDHLKFELDQALAENLRLKKTIEELRLENARLGAQSSEERARNKSLVAERDQLHRQNDGLESRVRTLKDTVAEREKKIEELGDERAKLAGEIDSLRATAEGLKVEIEALRSENAALEKAIAGRNPKR